MNWSLTHDDRGARVPVAPSKEWGAFTWLALRASRSQALGALRATLALWLAQPDDAHTHAVALREHHGWSLIGEPRVDLDERVLHAQSAQMIAQLAQLDAAFVAHDPHSGLLQLHVFAGGEPRLLWQDALDARLASSAMSFQEDGTCEVSDARRHALDALGIPQEHDWLDRHTFIEFSLHALGIHELDPTFSSAASERALLVRDLDA